MLIKKEKTLIVLPHLDDEFALTPLIKYMRQCSTEIVVIYCAERISSLLKYQKQRRIDNAKSLRMLGIKLNKVIYLNDYFLVEDNKLYKSCIKIYKFLDNFLNFNNFQQLFTLNFEGGHPDHDQIALIINRLSLIHSFRVFYFPSYNSRKTLFFPYSVLRPLKEQDSYAKSLKFQSFCWANVLRMFLIYSTERWAFAFMLPFLIIKVFFSKELIFFDKLVTCTVNWEKSLSLKRYKVPLSALMNQFDQI